MIRTQIQLPEPEFHRLKEISARRKRSMADCIREGIKLFLAGDQSSGDDFSDIAGKYRPQSLAGLKNHDRWLTEGILAGKKPRRRK